MQVPASAIFLATCDKIYIEYNLLFFNDNYIGRNFCEELISPKHRLWIDETLTNCAEIVFFI